MAQQGRQLDEATRRQLERARESGASVREAARRAEVSKSTAQKYFEKSRVSSLHFGTHFGNS